MGCDMLSVKNHENQAKTLKIPYPTFEKLIYLAFQAKCSTFWKVNLKAKTLKSGETLKNHIPEKLFGKSI